MREFFKGWRRKVGLVTLGMAVAYVSLYFAIVQAIPSGIYRVNYGPAPKTAIYPIGREVGFGSVRRFSCDGFTHPLFAPINFLDRRIRPSVWLE